MKITEALAILHLPKIPSSEAELQSAYRSRAKDCHPDLGGSEAEFKQLGEALEYVKRAMLLMAQRTASGAEPVKSAKEREEEALKAKRAKMREELLKRRAVENAKRNRQATRTVGVIGSLAAIVVLWLSLRPSFVHWMVSRDTVERMAVVTESGFEQRFTIVWDYDGKRYEKRMRGRLIDGQWLVGESGMPMIRGGKYIVAFNAHRPDYFELRDAFIHPETAEMYFALVKHPLSVLLDLPVNDSHLICTYWGVLNEFGVDGVAHLMFSGLPMQKNWSHNERSAAALMESEGFKEVVRSCLAE